MLFLIQTSSIATHPSIRRAEDPSPTSSKSNIIELEYSAGCASLRASPSSISHTSIHPGGRQLQEIALDWDWPVEWRWSWASPRTCQGAGRWIRKLPSSPLAARKRSDANVIVIKLDIAARCLLESNVILFGSGRLCCFVIFHVSQRIGNGHGR